MHESQPAVRNDMSDFAPPTSPMKILIVATPKSGNHWLKSLLSEIYDLPMLDAPDWRVRERWAGHDHFWPEDSTLDWLRRDGITPVTITRHPFDVLVSLYHHIWMKADVPPYEQCVLRDKERIGDGTEEYVRSQFYSLLLISQAWRSIAAPCVRFEDLLADPEGTLRILTDSIAPVDDAAIRRAICSSSFSVMRSAHKSSSYIKSGNNFFRKGGSGYRQELPEQIICLLSSGAFAELMFEQGYTPVMEPIQPFDMSVLDPLQGHRAFSNGAYISAKFYRLLMRVPNLTQRWTQPWDCSNDESLFNWLNSPVAGRPFTNLMMLIYFRRPDLMRTFPLETRVRDFCLWFLTFASYEYDFGAEFLKPVFNLVRERPELQRSVSLPVLA